MTPVVWSNLDTFRGWVQIEMTVQRHRCLQVTVGHARATNPIAALSVFLRLGPRYTTLYVVLWCKVSLGR